MQGENGVVKVPANPASVPPGLNDGGGAAHKADLIRQFASSGNSGDGGLIAQLSNNPFFTAGFGLAGLTAIAAFGRRGIRHGAALMRRRLLVDVEISVRDDSYPWFLYWMTLHERGRLVEHAAQAKASRFESLLQRLTPGMRHLAIETEKRELPNGAIHTNFVLIPGPGRHVLRYNGAWIFVNRQREGKQFSMDGKPWETVTLTTLYSQRHVFESLFKEAHDIATQSVEGKTVIYTAWGTKWDKFGNPRSKRPLESVILDKGVKERIVSDVQDFLASAKWYYERGIPYRRGYLLYGPPGTGKSSFIQALAGHLNYDIAMLNLSERGLTDDRLNHLLTVIPQRTLVLLEDVDAAFANRRQVEADGYQGANVTFSGLLNALDGVGSAEERIIFLTTNHVDRLDEALVRPGRVDMTVRLGEATTYQIEQLWARFYSEQDPEGHFKARFLGRLHELGVLSGPSAVSSRTSMAALQGLFLYNKGNPQGAIDMAWQLAPGGLPSALTKESRAHAKAA
ncbi:mitochondrial chaperone BCS1 [Cladophialophora yegresii CBS 114405]|uniref:Mitochondrial chaperone BCS1 n=1 Tax=Cladophialophora yegresii CBS 114405 TaxID=1182544 RepID=W9VP54_9EURO|nr:mitochondrial chaperone BCS1 [Cladophialophora yegresii CBS 114405]EXJ57497.1 mitochondrial chaperone BCS1 [Cladophialophora yegresii CBS 114405]